MKKSQTNKQAPAKSAPTAPAAEVDLEAIASAFHPHEDDGGYGSDAAFRAPAPTEILILPRSGIEETAIRLGGILKKSGQFFRRGCAVYQLRGSKFCEITAGEAMTVIPRFFARFAEIRRDLKSNEAVQIFVDIGARKMETLWSSPLLIEQLPEPRCVLSWPAPVIESGVARLLSRGFDDRSRVLTVADMRLDEMTLPQSVQILRETLAEFPFANHEIDLSCHLAAMLTLWALPLLPPDALLPGIVYSANMPRTGKSLLAKMVAITVQGKPFEPFVMRADDKLQAQIDGAALEGWPCLIFDNCKQKISSQLLEAFMTSSCWTGRHFHKQKLFTIRKQTLVGFTANAPRISADITERVLVCELHRREADPSMRKISRVMDETFLIRPDIRKRLLSALWGLVRAWASAGRPPGEGRMRAGFEQWSRVVPPILEHAGFASPLAEREFVQMDAPGAEAKNLVELLFKKFARQATPPEAVFSFSEIWSECVEAEIFVEKLAGHNEKISLENGPSAASKSSLAKTLASIFGASFEHRMTHRLAFKTPAPAPPESKSEVREVWAVDCWRGGRVGQRKYHIRGNRDVQQ
jgi:hypothetical protein